MPRENERIGGPGCRDEAVAADLVRRAVTLARSQQIGSLAALRGALLAEGAGAPDVERALRFWANASTWPGAR